jgi:hypothetical protein
MTLTMTPKYGQEMLLNPYMFCVFAFDGNEKGK